MAQREGPRILPNHLARPFLTHHITSQPGRKEFIPTSPHACTPSMRWFAEPNCLLQGLLHQRTK